MKVLKSLDDLYSLPNSVRNVAEAYADLHEFARDSMKERNLRTLVPMGSWDEFCQALEVIGEYNGFQAKKVVKALEPYKDLCTLFLVGREYSPVVYLQLPAGTRLEIVGRRSFACADEKHDWAGGLLRLWWD